MILSVPFTMRCIGIVMPDTIDQAKTRGGQELTYVIPQSHQQARDAQAPEDEPQWLGHAQLGGGRLGLEVEGQHDGDGDHGHVHREAQVA